MSFIYKLIVLVAAGTCFYHISLKTNVSHKKLKTILLSPPLATTSNTFDRIATLGHIGIYHTFLNVWSVQILIDIKEEYEHDKLFKGLEQIRKKKIRFESFYLFACITAHTLKRPELCMDYTRTGLELYPVSWRITMAQGYVSYFELDNPAEGALFYNLASTDPYAPDYVARVARKLYNKTNLTDEELDQMRDDMSKVIKDFQKIQIVDQSVLDKKKEEDEKAKEEEAKKEKAKNETENGKATTFRVEEENLDERSTTE